MDRNGKYNLNSVQTLIRGTSDWIAFVNWQKERILERLNRYNKLETTKEQLQETGEQSPYQVYKIHSVSSYLREALARMEKGQYGVCKYCGCDIPNQRLLLVPGALQCMKCEIKPKSNGKFGV